MAENKPGLDRGIPNGDTQVDLKNFYDARSVRRDVLMRAQESNDDRLVEAAGKEGGLRGALAARMDAWSRAAGNFRERFTIQRRAYKKTSLDLARKNLLLLPLGMSYVLSAAGYGVWSEIGGVAQKTTAFLRDRLAPKPKVAPVAKSAK